jgi:hypothetical protein
MIHSSTPTTPELQKLLKRQKKQEKNQQADALCIKFNQAVGELHRLMCEHQCTLLDIYAVRYFKARRPALSQALTMDFGLFGKYEDGWAMEAMLEYEYRGVDFRRVVPVVRQLVRGGFELSGFDYPLGRYKEDHYFLPPHHEFAETAEWGDYQDEPQFGCTYQADAQDNMLYSTLARTTRADIWQQFEKGKLLCPDALMTFTDTDAGFLDELFSAGAIPPEGQLLDIALRQLLSMGNPRLAEVMLRHMLNWGLPPCYCYDHIENVLSYDRDNEELDAMMEEIFKRQRKDRLETLLPENNPSNATNKAVQRETRKVKI